MIRLAACLLIMCGAAACLFSARHVSAQSGRNSKREEEPRAIKPVPLPPIIKPPSERPVTRKNDDDTIRINSDLVTVVATLSSAAATASVAPVAPAAAAKNDPKHAEQPEPTSNAPVALTRDDFEVLEDGVPQEITNFSRESEAPLQLVMLFDTSLSVALRLGFEKKAAENFFKRLMRPQDRAAIFAVATHVELLQPFTNRVPALISATKQLKAEGATSLYDGVFLAAEYLAAARNAATGRRIIVLVTDGGDTVSDKTLKQALKQAQDADAMIYAVYTGNLWNSLNLLDLGAERALQTLTSETGGQMYRPKIEAPQRRDDDERSLKELDASFARLADELRTQYVLGFYSSNETRDGRFRKLAVRVKTPGYAVRARVGYYAPKD